MDCCENFISIYTKVKTIINFLLYINLCLIEQQNILKVIEIYNSKNDGHWSVETKDVHMFLDRCRDVNYICKSIILFKRYLNSYIHKISEYTIHTYT